MSRGPLDGFTEPRGRIPKTRKRYRDAGALHAQHTNTDLVRFRVFADGDERWAWAEKNKDPRLGVDGKSLKEIRHRAIGQLVLVYDPDCSICPGELEGCHYCHAPYNSTPCPICGRGLFMTDDHGWNTNPETGDALMFARDYNLKRPPYYSNPEDADVDLDFVPLNELAEYGDLPYFVARALIDWQRQFLPSAEEYRHYVASFLDMLAVNGYGVVKIEAPNLADLLPAPEGS